MLKKILDRFEKEFGIVHVNCREGKVYSGKDSCGDKVKAFLTQAIQEVVDSVPCGEIGKIPSRETLRILKEYAEVGRIDGYNQHVQEIKDWKESFKTN